MAAESSEKVLGDEVALLSSFREGDESVVVARLRNDFFSTEFKSDLLTSAVENGKPQVMRHLLAEALQEDGLDKQMVLLMLLNLAATKQQIACVREIFDVCCTEDVRPLDALQIIYERLPLQDRITFTQNVLERVPREEADFLLREMLWASVTAKSFEMTGVLLEYGADANVEHGMMLLSVLMNAPEEFHSHRTQYISLIDKILFKSNYDHPLMTDVALSCVVTQVAEGKQYPEIVAMLLDGGADPYLYAGAELRHLVEGRTALLADGQTVDWASVFSIAQQAAQVAAKAEFVGLFGGEEIPAVADMLRPLSSSGETGLMLAVKAGMVEDVVRAFVRQGVRLSFDDVKLLNERHQNVLSLAADRGDLEKVFHPALWQMRGSEAVSFLYRELSPIHRESVDLSKIDFEFERHRMVKIATGVKDRFKPKV